MRAMCAVVLVFEAVVLALTAPVMVAVAGVPPAPALAVGFGLAVAALTVAALLRHRWAYVAGTVLQGAAIALGAVVPVMLLLGPLFAAFWVLALVFGMRADDVRRARARQRGATAR